MLNSDPQKLRFLGIDLHSRLRRRFVVVLIYFLYLVLNLVVSQATRNIPELQRYHTAYWFLFAVSFLVIYSGPFREEGVVKRFLFVSLRGKAVTGAALAQSDTGDLAARNRALAMTVQLIAALCFIWSATYAFTERSPIYPIDFAETLLTVAVIAVTWPKAVILWGEPDPHT